MKENQRVTLTKRMLKDALLRIVETKNIDKITVSELCLEAGINRATFYRHFEYPKDVLIEVQSDFFQKMLESLNKTVYPMEPALFLEALFTYVAENAELMRIFLRCTSDIEFLTMFNDIYRDILSSNKMIAVLEGYDEDKRDLIFAYLSGGAYYFLKQWLLTDMKKTPKELSAIVLEIFNRDLLPIP